MATFQRRTADGRQSQRVALLSVGSLPPKPPPTSVAEYIRSAPVQGQGHLTKLYGILKNVAPDAVEVLDYGVPFFTEPKFLFSFTAWEDALSFAPTDEGLKPFRSDLKDYKIKHGGVFFSYSKRLPGELIRIIAAHRVDELSQSKGGRVFR